MNVFQQGTSINLVETFWTVDPITQVSTPADPADVVFEIEAPDATITTYTFGVDMEVSNPSVGTYVCSIGPMVDPGNYLWECNGSGGGIDASSNGAFEVLAGGILAPPAATMQFGPCQPWATGSDVVACGPDLGVGSEVWRLDDSAADASAILYELSGRQYPGLCTRTVRPCSDRTGCWHDSEERYYWWAFDYSWWRNEQGPRRCGCHRPSEVKLAGYPIRRIVEVKIDGDVLPYLDADSNPNYRLDKHRFLTRMDSPGPPFVRRFWPGCQNTSLEDTQAGTFSVSYEWGADPPTLGRLAAAQLARELWGACTGGECKLPTKVTKVVRSGITIERASSLAKMLRQGSTGLQILDSFIAASNPSGAGRRPAVFSPDVQPFAKRLG